MSTRPAAPSRARATAASAAPSSSAAAAASSAAADVDADAGLDLVGAKKKKRTRTRPFSTEDLISRRGMWLLYDETRRRPPRAEAGSEADDLLAVMQGYRAWARQLNPARHPLDTLAKAAEWGGKGVVRDVMSRMREDLEVPRALGLRQPTADRYDEATAAARARAEAQSRAHRGKRVIGERTDVDGESGGRGEGGAAEEDEGGDGYGYEDEDEDERGGAGAEVGAGAGDGAL